MSQLSKMLDEYRKNNKDQYDLVEEATNGLKEAGNGGKNEQDFNPDKAIKIMRDDLADPSRWC